MQSKKAEQLAREKLLEWVADKMEVIKKNENRFVMSTGKYEGKWEARIGIYPNKIVELNKLEDAWKCVGPDVLQPNDWLRAVVEDTGVVKILQLGNFDDLFNL